MKNNCLPPYVDISRVGSSQTRLNQRNTHLCLNLIPFEAVQIEHPIVNQTLDITISVVDFSAGQQDKT